MNDQQIIQKAVELVGWLECDDEGEYLQIPAQPFSAYLDEISAPCEQYLIDALAAELVRMVDEIHPEMLTVWSDLSRLRIGKGERVFGEGNGRTMNTLTAIIESKVLEGGE